MDREVSPVKRNEWIVRVLEKIRELVLEGSLAFFADNNLIWIFDVYGYNIIDKGEMRALLMMASIKVIDIKIYHKNNKAAREIFSDNEKNEINHKMDIMITGFNPIQYEKICKVYSVEPYDDTYNVRFVLSDNTPYIYYPYNKPHRFRTLKSGKPLTLIQACYDSEEMILRKKDFAAHNITINNKTSLRQFFKDDTLLNCQDGILKPFIQVGTDYIRIKPVAKIHKDELSKMLEIAEG